MCFTFRFHLYSFYTAYMSRCSAFSRLHVKQSDRKKHGTVYHSLIFPANIIIKIQNTENACIFLCYLCQSKVTPVNAMKIRASKVITLLILNLNIR